MSRPFDSFLSMTASSKETTEEEKEMKIVVSENGPYIVSAGIPLSIQVITSNKERFSWDWKQASLSKQVASPHTASAAAVIPTTNLSATEPT